MADAREGKVLQGRYRIMSMLAEGGMGVVYKAERVGIGRPVVVKFLHAILSDKPGIVDRFEREARATARLNHPHCVALIDFGIDDGSPYLVMEFVEGQTLADLLDHGAVKGERAVAIVRQILAGLEHAHERGILHRDLKPANVMIIEVEGYSTDFVKILDFGLAKLAWPGEDKRDVTVEGIAIGTPGYMSPEQAAGVPSDRRSDIYCTGALLYHMVTGSKAFEGDDVRSVLRRHREETPASPREIKAAAGLSKQLEDVIERAMQRDPAKRFQTARDMMAALDGTPEWKRRGDGDRPSASSSRPPTPTALDRTRAEGPSGRRGRQSARRTFTWIVVGALAGSTGALAAVVYSPLGKLLQPQHPTEVVTSTPSSRPSGAAATAPHERPAAHDRAAPAPEPSVAPPATATSNAPAAESGAAGSAGAPAAATAPTTPTGTPTSGEAAPAGRDNTPTATASRLPTGPSATRPSSEPSAAAGSDEDEDTDPSPGNGDDGSNESDRTPPPEPAAAPRREASQVRSIGDARALIRKGDYDGALAGLYRLRRGRPTPSASRSSEIATLIGHLYFERKWWTDALREYRFAIALDPRARRDEALLGNSVRALSDRGTYLRARRLILEYVGRTAVPSLKRAARSGSTAALRRRSQKVLATLESKSYRTRR